MIDGENLITEGFKAACAQLASDIYADCKIWLTSLGTSAQKTIRRTTSKNFFSFEELFTALRKGELQEGERIVLECKPSPFAPFDRNLFLIPSIGNSTNLRLGPQFVDTRREIAQLPGISLLPNFWINYLPVGCLPVISDSVHQVVLYPQDSLACAITLSDFNRMWLPGLEQINYRFPALIHSSFSRFLNRSCRIAGTVRQVPIQSFIDNGGTPENFESLRQLGYLWFLDAADEDSRCTPIDENPEQELWGGLYASGHLEIVEGNVSPKDIVDGFEQVFRKHDFEPRIRQHTDQSGQSLLVAARGLRAALHLGLRFYYIHMDANIGYEFARYSRQFDQIVVDTIDSIGKACDATNSVIANRDDLDFCYRSGIEGVSILESSAAQLVEDPLAISIMNWHRQL